MKYTQSHLHNKGLLYGGNKLHQSLVPESGGKGSHPTPALPVFLSHLNGGKGYIRRNSCALAGVAQWVERQPANQSITGLIPSQGTYLGCRPGPHWGGAQETTTLMFLSFSFSLPSPLSKIFFKRKRNSCDGHRPEI